MITNQIDIDSATRSEITRFIGSQSGRLMIEWLESQAPHPEEVPQSGGAYAPEHIYHIRAGVSQGYADCLYNLRSIPDIATKEETENNNELKTIE